VGGAALAAAEDWQLSQFWYDADTGVALAREVLAAVADAYPDGFQSTGDGSGSGQRHRRPTVALLSCPSTYKALLTVGIPAGVTVRIFEFDRRFARFGDAFVFYDFNKPLDLPPELRSACDVIMMDPPFINEATLAAFAASAAALRRGADTRVLLCTGSVMVEPARRLLALRPTTAHVGHANRLSNPFTLYVSHAASAARVGGYDDEAERAAGRHGESGAASASVSASGSLSDGTSSGRGSGSDDHGDGRAVVGRG
jgi:hypothetical protein